MKLVVGLGNPGRKYAGTRHNVGWEVVAALARSLAADSPRTKFEAEICEASLGGEKILLLAPHTFMNNSGRSVGQAVDFYKTPADDVMVVCDDFNLPLGELRIRARGSDGGQRGLADIHRRLGTTEVPRTRVGIGPVPDRWDPADFVLSKFNRQEQETVQQQIARAAEAIQTWVTSGVDAAMNQYNGR